MKKGRWVIQRLISSPGSDRRHLHITVLGHNKQRMQALNQYWIDFGEVVAASLRRRGILSAVQGQSAGGIIDANALDRIIIEGIFLDDLSPGLRDELEELNNVPVVGFYPIPPQLTSVQQHIRELSREMRVSEVAKLVKSINKSNWLC